MDDGDEGRIIQAFADLFALCNHRGISFDDLSLQAELEIEVDTIEKPKKGKLGQWNKLGCKNPLADDDEAEEISENPEE